MTSRLNRAKISGSTDTTDSGANIRNKLPVSHHEKGKPSKTANPIAYKNSLLMRYIMRSHTCAQYFADADFLHLFA